MGPTLRSQDQSFFFSISAANLEIESGAKPESGKAGVLKR
jgi:hypothetical protein